MCMRSAHAAFATPWALGTVWAGAVWFHVPLAPDIAAGALVVYWSGGPDFDHPHGGINRDLGPISKTLGMFIRWVCWTIYRFTRNEYDDTKEWRGAYYNVTNISVARFRWLHPLRMFRHWLRRLQIIGDCHRETAHTIEGCLGFGAVFGAATYPLPLVGDYALLFGIATFLGCLSHVLSDALTPSGVPLSITYNVLTPGGNWKRHSWPWFKTNSAAEKTLFAPACWTVSVLIVLFMAGLATPLLHLITGIN
jgi:membrane-bound metal-dependent hydrolase YbcI (DUF457 family)